MGGCTNCGSKKGCDHRKGAMLSAVGDTLARLYPTRTWGERDDDLAWGGGADDDEIAALADELGQELNTATFVRHGAEDEACDYIYVLCLGRPPCLAQVRDGAVPIPEEWRGTEGIREQYLRVCVSRIARVVGVQQVAMELVAMADGVAIREVPRAGVYDAPLLARFQKLVAVLPAYDLLHLDFGEISAPPPGYAGGAWRDDYGLGAGDPAVANYLFFPQPATSPVTTWIPLAREAAAS
jgi:hypothetical protein